MKKVFLSCLLLLAVIGFCCIQKQEEISVTPKNKNQSVIVKEEFPIAIIYGGPIYEKMKVVIVNTSRAYLPLSNVSIAKTLWPSFGIRIEYEGQFEKGKYFEFRRVLVIDASKNITSLSIEGGKILSPEDFEELNVSISLIGEGIKECAEVYGEKGHPVAFFWEDERLKLEPGIYRLEVVVSGIPKFSAYSSIQILTDVRFSVPPSFIQNESITRKLDLNRYSISYRTIGGVGWDEAWSIDGGVYVGGFVRTSKFRDAIVIKLNGTDVLWAKVWDSGKDEWIWDVSEGDGCVYSAVSTFENGVLLKLSDEGMLIWAKELRFEDEDVYTDLTAVMYYDGYLFAGGNFLAKINPNGEVLWCKYPFGLIKDIQIFRDYIYILDENIIFKFDLWGNLVWAKTIDKEGSYVYLKSMHVTPDGIYVLGWIEDSVALFMLDHDGNLHWAKRLTQESLTGSLYVDRGNVYIVGGLPKGNSFLIIFDPTSDEVQGIIISGCDLRDITFDKNIYCIGCTQSQNLGFYLANFTMSNIDVNVKGLNWSFKSCDLTLSDAKGSLIDFTVGSGKNSDILIVRVNLK